MAVCVHREEVAITNMYFVKYLQTHFWVSCVWLLQW